MSESVTSPLAAGQRMLAAIVFTDAADFSARVTEDEGPALKAVQRDLSMMSEACRQFDGQVVKNTGDGLMMLFASAVQAVHCAIEIQRRLAEAARILPTAAAFDHRIGVHLGDVVLTGGDALGDGVNIAARLQEHAEPGGICMSQTVFEVVRSSLVVPVEGPEALHLKNIETVQALRIGPRALTGQVTRHARGRKKGAQGYVWIAAGIVVLAAAIAYVGYSLSESLRRVSIGQPAAPTQPGGPPQPADQSKPGGPTPQQRPPEGGSIAAASPPRVAASPPKTAVSPPKTETSAVPVPTPSPPAAPPKEVTAPVPTEPETGAKSRPGRRPGAAGETRDLSELEKRRVEARTTYAYGGFVTWLDAQQDLRGAPPIQSMMRRYRLLDEMITWLKATVAATTSAQPLQIHPDVAGVEESKAWGAGGRVVFAGRGGTMTSDWSQLPPRMLGSLLEAANRAKPPQGAEALRHRMWGIAFTDEYGLKPRQPQSPR